MIPEDDYEVTEEQVDTPEYPELPVLDPPQQPGGWEDGDWQWSQ